jgi:hypothetical protein
MAARGRLLPRLATEGQDIDTGKRSRNGKPIKSASLSSSLTKSSISGKARGKKEETHPLRRLLRHQLLVRPDRDPSHAMVIRLGDGPDEVSGEGDGHVGRELGVGLGDALVDPFG